MVTETERREVTRNIRENYVCGGLGYKMASSYNIAMAIGMNPGILVGDIELWERLADLIEPSPSCEFRDAEEQEGKEQDMKFEMLGVVNSITGVIFDLRQKVEVSEVDVNGEGASITFTVPVDQAKNLFGKVAKITVEVEE